MKILFIQTNTNSSLIPLPVGPAIVAARLREDGHDVAFVDLMGERNPVRTAVDAARAFVPALVCYSVRNRDNQTMLRYEDPLPGIRNIVGAVHDVTHVPSLLGGTAFTTYPTRLLEYLLADYGLAGDDTAMVLRFVRSLENGSADLSTPGLVYRNPWGRIVENPFTLVGYPRLLPSYHDFIDKKRYRHAYWDAAVITRTGCPEHCAYCDTFTTFGRDFILRDPDDVVDELLALKRAGRAHSAWFVDAGFNRPLEHAKNILESIIRRGAQLRYYALFDPGPADDEFFTLFRRAGGTGFTVFAESLSDPVLAALGKSFTVADVLRDTAAMKRHALSCMFMPTLGSPGETPDTVRETFERTPALGAVFSYFSIGWRIQPGTPLRDRAVQEGLLRADDDCWLPTFYVSPDTPRPWLEKRIRGFKLRHPLLNLRIMGAFSREMFRRPWMWDAGVSKG